MSFLSRSEPRSPLANASKACMHNMVHHSQFGGATNGIHRFAKSSGIRICSVQRIARRLCEPVNATDANQSATDANQMPL